MLYGFNEQHARLLKRVARREGLRAVTGTRVRYPQPFADDGFVAAVGKPDQNIAKGDTDTVSIYNADTEQDTFENVEAKALFAAVTSGKWVSLAVINGIWIVSPGEC